MKNRLLNINLENLLEEGEIQQDELKEIQNQVEEYTDNEEMVNSLSENIDKDEEKLNSGEEVGLQDAIESEVAFESFSLFFANCSRRKAIHAFNLESIDVCKTPRDVLKTSIDNKKFLLGKVKACLESSELKLSDAAKDLIKSKAKFKMYVKLSDSSLQEVIVSENNSNLLDFLKNENPLQSLLKIDSAIEAIESINDAESDKEDWDMIGTNDVAAIEGIVANCLKVSSNLNKLKTDNANRSLVKELGKEDFSNGTSYIFGEENYSKRLKECLSIIKSNKANLSKVLKPEEISSLEKSINSLIAFIKDFYGFLNKNVVVEK